MCAGNAALASVKRENLQKACTGNYAEAGGMGRAAVQFTKGITMADEKPKRLTPEDLIAELRGQDQSQLVTLGEVVGLMEMMDGHLRALSLTRKALENTDRKLEAVASKVLQLHGRMVLIESAVHRASRN